MRAVAILLLPLALVACEPPKGPETAHTPIAPAAQNEPAPRKAGLWEVKVSDGATSQVTKYCLDAATDRAARDIGRDLNAKNCSRHEMQPLEGGAWKFSTDCDFGAAGHLITEGVATGDFTSGYQLRVETREEGGASHGVRHRLVVDAGWRGACPAGMKPGDVSGPQ